MNPIKLDREIEQINKYLKDEFGIDTVTTKPMFRVVWNTDQMEKAYGTFVDYTSEGLFIREVTEERIVPKYRGFPKDRYVLERLVQVPLQQQDQLLGLKISYEGLWTFSDKNGNFVYPKYNACKFIIDTVLAAQAVATKMIDPDTKRHHTLTQYLPDKENTSEGILEEKRKQINEIIVALAGEESGLGGNTLNCGSAIAMPPNYERNKS